MYIRYINIENDKLFIFFFIKFLYDNLSVYVYIMMFRLCIIGKIFCFRIVRIVFWIYFDDF